MDCLWISQAFAACQARGSASRGAARRAPYARPVRGTPKSSSTRAVAALTASQTLEVWAPQTVADALTRTLGARVPLLGQIPLDTRLRESGKVVYGLGEKKTPASLQNACDRFIRLESLGRNRKEQSVRLRAVGGRRAA